MTKLTREDVLKLARLSRLHVTDDEVTAYVTEISTILEYVDKLQDVDVTGLEPTSQVTGLANVMRPDVVKAYQATPKTLLKNVPATEAGQIKVKRMLA